MTLSRLLAIVACGSMLALTIPAAPAIANNSHVYSGKQIFEGVFFGRGPVAQRLPDFWASSSVASYRGTMASAYFGRELSTVETKIAKHDPTYFTQLQRDMTSGDPGLVQHAIEITRNEVVAVMPKSSAQRSDNPFIAPSHDGDAEDTVVILLLVAVVVVIAVVPEKNLKTAIQSPFNNDRAAALIASALQS